MRIELFEGRQIAILEIEGRPWFRASAICDALEIVQASQAVERIPEEHKQKIDLRDSVSTAHGIRGRGNRSSVWFVDHEGSLRLVMQSRSPKAEPLQALMARVVAQYQRGELGGAAVLERIAEGMTSALSRIEQMMSRAFERLDALERRPPLLGSGIDEMRLGQNRHLPGAIVVRTPTQDEYHTVSDEIHRQGILVPEPMRSPFGRRVGRLYRRESAAHEDWPREPLLIKRAGNHYPPQTWEWLARAVHQVARDMGLLPGGERTATQAGLFN